MSGITNSFKSWYTPNLRYYMPTIADLKPLGSELPRRGEEMEKKEYLFRVYASSIDEAIQELQLAKNAEPEMVQIAEPGDIWFLSSGVTAEQL
jgi:hypothetical protein